MARQVKALAAKSAHMRYSSHTGELWNYGRRTEAMSTSHHLALKV